MSLSVHTCYVRCGFIKIQGHEPNLRAANYSYENDRRLYGHDFVERKRNRSLDQRPGRGRLGVFCEVLGVGVGIDGF